MEGTKGGGNVLGYNRVDLICTILTKKSADLQATEQLGWSSVLLVL